MLQEIVLCVCMLIEPAHCKDGHVQVASALDANLQVALNCLRQGQTEDQKWIEGHPGWRIDRWKCPALDGEVSF